MEIKKLVIDRALWGKGALLQEDGKMCCLGHLGRACGVDKNYLRPFLHYGLGYPDDMSQSQGR